MLKNRKAAGTMFFIIISAVIALIVLAILTNIFTTQTSKSVKDLESCGVRGGQCTPRACGEGEVEIGGVTCDPLITENQDDPEDFYTVTTKQVCCTQI